MALSRACCVSAGLAVVSAIWAAILPTARAADGPTPQKLAATLKFDRRAAFAQRVFTLTDLVLNHHINPPPRQQMIAEGFNTLLHEANRATPPELSSRISEVRTKEELAALLTQYWPTYKKPAGRARDAAEAQLEEAFVSGLLDAAPGHSMLLPGKEARVQTQIQANRYVGLGIALQTDGELKMPRIAKTLPGGTAELGGIKGGDLIEEIDHKPVAPRTPLTQVVDRLRGEEGSTVVLRIRREGSKAPLSFTLLRLPVKFVTVDEVPIAAGSKKNASPRIRMLRIQSISASAAQELGAWERKFRATGVDAVILDLRDLQGSGHDTLHAAMLLADSLLDAKPLGKLRTRERIQEFTADRDCLFRGLPLAVLIDHRTGGAAEWVAAALQDADPPTTTHHRRAIIVGSASEGNNFVVGSVPVPGRDEVLDLATGLWERPIPARPKDNRPDSDETRVQFDPDTSVAATGTPFRPWKVVPDVAVEPEPRALDHVTKHVAPPKKQVVQTTKGDHAAKLSDAAYKVAAAGSPKDPNGPDRAVAAAIAQLTKEWGATEKTSQPKK